MNNFFFILRFVLIFWISSGWNILWIVKKVVFYEIKIFILIDIGSLILLNEFKELKY